MSRTDALVLLLLAVAFGLAVLPILLAIGLDPSTVGTMAVAYGAVAGVIAPLIARMKNGDQNG